MSDTIPNALKNINDGAREYYQKLRDYEKLDLSQAWSATRKKTSRPSRCSGCQQPKKIMTGDLHFYFEGFLYLKKDNKFIETKLRICLATSCTNNIIRSLNNKTTDIHYIERSIMKWNIAGWVGSNERLRAQYRRH